MDPKPEWMQGWNPYALVILLPVVAGMIGAAVAWMTGKGFASWVEMQKFRIQLRTEQSKAKTEQLKEQVEQEEIIRKQDKSKQLIDRIIEGNNTAEGYKQLLLVWDDRMRWLEDRDKQKDQKISDLESAHADCIKKHASESEKNKNLETRCLSIEKKYNELKTLFRTGKRDKWPSPGFLTPPDDPKPIADDTGEA
jgi:hypothetical protein